MDLLEMAETSSRWWDENCSSAVSSLVSPSDYDCMEQEPLFGLIELVCTTVVYVLLMIFGLSGNILTILVVWLRPYMRSSTYLYLSSMSVSDMLILLLLPLEVYKLWWPSLWPWGDLACKFTMFLSECCTFCTILHITFLSLERYLAVCWPITAKTLVTRRRTKTIIVCLWLAAAVSAAPVWVMVGVEKVGMENSKVSSWQEGEGLIGGEGEQGFLIGASRHGTLQDERPERNAWEENNGKDGWVDGIKDDREGIGEEKLRTEEREKGKPGDEGEAAEERKVKAEGERQNTLKEDEGGGSTDNMDSGQRGHCDKGECRWTNYAMTSGLLSAMLILSNLYFLLPVCILGLVYSLIARTLWYRPQSSRRDRSHKHTVKMLGVIVLAFVLCWLPFHVGRTIFTLYHGAHEQEWMGGQEPSNTLSHDTANTSTSNPASDFGFEMHPVTEKMVSRTRGGTGDILADVDTYAQTEMHTDTGPKPVDIGTDFLTTPMSIRSQNSPRPTLPTAGIAADAVTLNHLYSTLNETSQNDAYQLFHFFLTQYFNLVSSVFFYLSAAVNPLLYNLMSVRYKHAVHSLIRARSHSQSHRRQTLTAGQSTTTV